MTTVNMGNAQPGDLLRVAADGTDLEPSTGLVDVTAFSAADEEIIASGASTTGWTGVGLRTGNPLSVSTTWDAGGAVKAFFDVVTGAPALYYTFSPALDVSHRSYIAFDYLPDSEGPTGEEDLVPEFYATVASGAALTGTTQTQQLAWVGDETWNTVVLPLDGLTTITSVGFIRDSTLPNNVSNSRLPFHVRDLRLLHESELDQALRSSENVVALVPPTYTSPSTQIARPLIPAGKGILDPARGVLSNFNNVVHLHDYFAYVDGAETGETDVAADFARLINSAQPGQTIRATPGAVYRFDQDWGRILPSNLTIDLTGATIILTYLSNTPFVVPYETDGVSIIGGTWLGYYPVELPGSSLRNVTGTPTTVSTTKTLDAASEAVGWTYHLNNLIPPHFSRHLPQQLDLEPDDLGPRNYFEAVLSDSAQVANDCVLTITDYRTGDVLATETLTLTGTPTTYRIEAFPVSLRNELSFVITKATATTNTITVTSATSYGRNEYTSAYDVASAIALTSATNTLIKDCWFEGFGGDAVQVSNAEVSYLHVDGVTSRGMRRQGMSFNQGTDMLIENCVITETGRSALDFEPFATDWFTQRVHVRNIELHNIVNYGFAMANWARNFDYIIEDVKLSNSRLGMFHGGFVRGYIRNLANFDAFNGGGSDYDFMGKDMVIDGIRSTTRVECKTTTSLFDPDGLGDQTYTPSGNVLRNIYCALAEYGHSTVTVPAGYRLESAYVINTSDMSTIVPFSNDAPGPVRATHDDIGIVQLGYWHEYFGNTYKSPIAVGEMWMPGGWNHYDDPVYGVRSIGAGTTKRNNLRGRVQPTNGATSVVVTFPTRTVGTLTSFTAATTAATSGTLSTATTYYYRIAPRGITAGPGTFVAEQSAATGANTAVLLTVTPMWSSSDDRLIAGLTILRGTSAGTYNTRFDIVPDTRFWGAGNSLVVYDKGATVELRDLSADPDRVHGYAASYAAQSGSYTATNQTGYEPDINYDIFCTASWHTTIIPTDRRTDGFTLGFSDAAPTGSEGVAWFIVGF